MIRKRNFRWWSKFNYLLSAALDSGTVLSVIFIFFTLQFPKGGRIGIKWWGNEVFINSTSPASMRVIVQVGLTYSALAYDVMGVPLLPTGPDGFAPPPGN